MTTPGSDKDDIKDYVMRRLGEGTVCVELTGDHMDDCVLRAEEWWSQFFGTRKYALMVSTGTAEYDVPDDCDAVTEVIFESIGNSLADVFDWAGVSLGVWDLVGSRFGTGGSGMGGGYSDLVQQLQYLEQAKQIVSAIRDWDYDRVRRKLTIHPTPASGEKMAMYYLSSAVETSYMKRYELMIFRDLVYAYAMQTLGNIRSKYQDLPSASGTMTLNGDTLLTNSEQLLVILEEKARKLTKPVGFWAG